MRTQTRPTASDDPACHLSTPWVGLSLREQRAFLSFLETPRDRARFLETEANRILGMGRSEHYQRNADFRAEHTDGRSIFADFDADKNNSIDDGEPSELILDGSDDMRCGEADDEASEPRQDEETTLASSWVDCATDETLWGKNEWNAARALAPISLQNRDVLAGLASGMSVAEIADTIGRTPRQVRNIIQRLWTYVRGLDVAVIARHLDDPITTEAVTRRQPSRAGRKPRRVAAITTGVVVDLWGAHHQPLRRGRGPDRGPRRPRARPVCEGQLSFFDMAA